MASEYDALSDHELERIAASSREAFGALYERHADRVYDFVLRILRDPDEAADVTQETFVRAFRAITPERAGQAALTTWLLTIARNIAINRVQRGRTTPMSAIPGPDAQPFDAPAEAALSADPERAAETRDLAALVWEAAAGLDERQYAVLDLHVRQGLEPGELAGVLGVSKGNAYTILSRTKDAFESAVGALLMLRRGRGECRDLAETLDRAAISELTPEARKLIDRHTARCERCSDRKAQLMKASALFGTLAVLSVPFWRRAPMAEAAWNEVCIPDLGSTMLAASANGSGSGGGSPRIPLIAGGFGALILGVVTALIAANCASAGATGDATPTPTASPTVTRTVRPSVTPSATRGPASPTAAPSASPTPDPSTATPTRTATASPPPATASPKVNACPWAASIKVLGQPSPAPLVADELTALFDDYMVRNGLSPLSPDSRLYEAALEHAMFAASTNWERVHRELGVNIHLDLNCSRHQDRAAKHGYPGRVAENVYGSPDGAGATLFFDLFEHPSGWSPEDPARMSFMHMAIACATASDANGRYVACTQVFGVIP